MTHQNVWFGEHPSFGHESDKFVTTRSRPRRLRYRWHIIWSGIFLAAIAVAGEILNIYATGMLSRIGFVAGLGAALAILFYIADPIHASASAFFRRHKMPVVK